MVDLALSSARIGLALVLVGLNGFFVASEFAYVRIRAETVESFVEDGKPGATQLQAAMEDLDEYLAVTQLGITIASLGLGWVGEPAVAALIEPAVGPFLPESLVHVVAFAVGFGLITFLHVVFGELAPKTIAIAQAERVALLVAPPMYLFYYLFLPGIVVFNGTATAFTRLLGVPPASDSDETFSEEELRRALAQSGQKGEVSTREVEMIERVFELDDLTVSNVMIPRPDVRSVPADLAVPDLRTVVSEAGHTRYPVLNSGDADQVVGLLDVKDLLRVAERVKQDGDEMTAAELAREIPIVPETTTVADFLSELQRERTQMAAVIDEYGTFEGIATAEDVVEVVVGSLYDEFDVPGGEPAIDREEDGRLRVDGGVTLAELADRLDVDPAHSGFHTVGGLVLDRLGRPPEPGDSVEVDGYRFEVTGIDGMRVASLLVQSVEDSAS